MSIQKIIAAWKDPEFRSRLSADELSEIPDHPSGLIELTDEEQDEVVSAGSNTGRPGKPKPTPTPSKPPYGSWRQRPKGRVASWKPGY